MAQVAASFRGFASQWRAVPQLTPLLLIVLAIPVVFYGTTRGMVRVWSVNETFTHGFLILPMSLWLIWQQRAAIASVALRRDLRALIIFLPVLALWVLATLINVAALQQLAMVALVPLCVWLLLGPQLTATLLFPLLYLFFAVPLGQALIPSMMEFTADFTVRMVEITGIPVYRDGLSFQLPSGAWSVVEECSGVRYLIASAALGTLYAYITYRRHYKRALFILISLLLPIIANGLRAYGIVMIGHFSGMKYAVGADHLLYGWLFFGIVIFVLFWLGGFWADAPTDDPPGGMEETVASQDSTWAVPAAGLLAALFTLSVITETVSSAEVSLAAGMKLDLPARAGQWRAAPNGPTEEYRWRPRFHHPDLVAGQRYVRGDESVWLDAGYFHRQRDGVEAVSSLNRLVDPYDNRWKLTAQRSQSSDFDTVTESEVVLTGQKVLTWSGYLVGSGFDANPYRAKLTEIQQLLLGRRYGAFITLSTPVDHSVESSRARLSDAWKDLRTPLQEAIRDIGSGA